MNINESLADSLIRSTASMGKLAGRILKDRPAATRGGSPKSSIAQGCPSCPTRNPAGIGNLAIPALNVRPRA